VVQCPRSTLGLRVARSVGPWREWAERTRLESFAGSSKASTIIHGKAVKRHADEDHLALAALN